MQNKCFSERNINPDYDRFDKDVVVKKLETLKAEIKLKIKDFFQTIQSLHALTKSWEQNLKQVPINTDIFLCIEHHITKNQDC